MEVWCIDNVAKQACDGKKRLVVELVHVNLGLASVVKVSNVEKLQALKLETASGAFLMDYDLKEPIEVEEPC